MDESSFVTEPEAGPWPAFADLFAAASLLFLVLFAAVTIPAIKKNRRTTADRNTLVALTKALAPDTTKGYHLVSYKDHILVRIPEKATFPQGLYQLSEMHQEGRDILHSIAKRVRDEGLLDKINRIDVVGHTSSEGGDGRNWLLSAQRAVTVAMYLVQEEKLSACEVSAQGRGSYYPVDPSVARTRLKEDGMSQDRRIELEIWPIVLGDSARIRSRAGCVDRGEPAS